MIGWLRRLFRKKHVPTGSLEPDENGDYINYIPTDPKDLPDRIEIEAVDYADALRQLLELGALPTKPMPVDGGDPFHFLIANAAMHSGKPVYLERTGDD